MLQSIHDVEDLDKELQDLEVGPNGTRSRELRRKILNAMGTIEKQFELGLRGKKSDCGGPPKSSGPGTSNSGARYGKNKCMVGCTGVNSAE